jgi:mTERF domain-containing protein
MLRLRSCVVSHLLTPPTFSPVSNLHRLLSASAPPISPNPGFAVKDYLVNTCGLTRPQAIKASTQLSHFKSPANPDAVIAFLAGQGFSSADVAATVAKNPKLLCSGVERMLAPRFAGLTGLGFSGADIARLVPLLSVHFRLRSIVPKLHFCLHLFGSSGNLLRMLERDSYLLGPNLEKVVKPNVELLTCYGNAG